MTQAANYQVPAHPSGLDMRTQLNIIVAAILGDNCGPTAPTQTYPGMMWGDTTANRLRRRTNANDAWINIGPLDNFLGDIQGQITTATANKVSKTGDTMTGLLYFKGTGIQYVSAAGGSLGYISQDSSGPNGGWFGFINAVGNAWTLHWEGNDASNTSKFGGPITSQGGITASGGDIIANGRLCTFPGGSSPSTGEIRVAGPSGSMFMRARSSGAGMEWVNNGYTAVVMSTDDGGNFTANTVHSSGNLTVGPGNPGLWQNSDGNIYSQACGGWLSSVFAGKSPTNTQIPWATGLTQMSNGNAYSLGSPWFVAGLSGPGNGTLNAIGIQASWPRTP
jgi:hypothetical protein